MRMVSSVLLSGLTVALSHDVLLFILSLVSSYSFGLILWRLYLCPLAKVPGPRLAALTFWYEAYYDVVQKGRYAWKICDMHEKYGPIIRINPHEVHISDPDFHSEVYRPATSKGKTDKWPWALGSFGNLEAGLTTASHDIHRHRRSAYQGYFSRKAIRQMEPNIQVIINKLMERFEDFKASKNAVNLEPAFAAMTCDFIHEYCFQSTLDMCSRPDLGQKLTNASLKVAELAPLMKHFPWVEKVMSRLPVSIRVKLNPDIASMIELKRSFVDVVEESLSVRGTSEEKQIGDSASPKQTLINAMLDSDLPDAEKSVSRLRDEAQTMSLAGTLTTAMTISKAIFNILYDSSIYAQLMDELQSTVRSHRLQVDQPIPVQVLDDLPYLKACIYETLRCNYGTTNRHSRIRPDEPLTYTTNVKLLKPGSNPKTYILPAGTPVSMSTITHHNHTHIWPDPHTFNPDRFLPIDSAGPSGFSGNVLYQKYVGSFNAGTRQCAGINLAHTELLMGLGEFFRRFGGRVERKGKKDDNVKVVGGMRLAPWVDKARDVDCQRDLVIPLPGEDARGIWVELHEVED